jgi:hypothetical protein
MSWFLKEMQMLMRKEWRGGTEIDWNKDLRPIRTGAGEGVYGL